MQQQIESKPVRQERVAVVVSDKMNKTRVVAVQWFRKHRVYGRAVRRLSKFKAHDEKNEARRGDTVRIVETRPMSKDKRWRIVEIITKAPIVDVAPEEIDAELLATKLKSPAASETAPSVAAAPAPAAEVPPAPAAEKKPAAKAPKAEGEANPKAKKAEKAEPSEKKAPAKKPAKKSEEPKK
jgi:small subunit ribosomal protein S17